MIAELFPELADHDDGLEDFTWPTRLGPGVAVSTPFGAVHSALELGDSTVLDSRIPDRAMWHRRTSVRFGLWSHPLVKAGVAVVPASLWFRQQPGEGRWVILWRIALAAQRPEASATFALAPDNLAMHGSPYTDFQEFRVAWATPLGDPSPMSLSLATSCSEPEDVSWRTTPVYETLCGDGGPHIADDHNGLVIPLPTSGAAERVSLAVSITWMRPYWVEDGYETSANISPASVVDLGLGRASG